MAMVAPPCTAQRRTSLATAVCCTVVTSGRDPQGIKSKTFPFQRVCFHSALLPLEAVIRMVTACVTAPSNVSSTHQCLDKRLFEGI